MSEPIFYTLGRVYGIVNFESDVFKMALISSGYTPSVDHQAYSDISMYVMSTPTTVANQTFVDSVFDCDDVVLSPATGTYQYIVFYKYGGPLVCYWDEGAIVIENEEITLEVASWGLFTAGFQKEFFLEWGFSDYFFPEDMHSDWFGD
jgi:hypothetical protein